MPGSDKDERRVLGRTSEESSFPVPPAAHEMPHDYALIRKIEGDVGVNANYLSHASSSTISS